MIFGPRSLAALAAAAVAACAADPAPPPAAAPEGAEPFRVGYADGCSSGLRAADGDETYASDQEGGEGDLSARGRVYLHGWVAGHYACRLLARRRGLEI